MKNKKTVILFENELLKQVVESSEFVEIDKLIDDYFMEIMDSYNNSNERARA